MAKICYVVTIPETIESFFIPQLQYLASKKYNVTVVCSHSDTLKKKLGKNVNYVSVDIPRGVSIGGSLSAIKTLTRLFKDEKFDLIQYSTPNAALYASIAAKQVGCKVRNYHLMGFRYLGVSGVGGIILKEFEKLVCKNSTSIECVSKSNLEIGIQEGIFKKEKATVVGNGSTGGIDLKRFDHTYREKFREEIRRKFGIKKDVFVYGFVGRITKDKGINEVLEAFSRIENANLMMIGNPEAVGTLDQQLYLQSLNDPCVIYTGSVSDVERYYSAIDVLLLPSYREGFGNVIIEAAAMETPAIVSDIPGIADAIVKEKTALVVEPKNVQDLFLAMKAMQQRDYVSMGKEACEFVKSYFASNVLCEKILKRKELLLS